MASYRPPELFDDPDRMQIDASPLGSSGLGSTITIHADDPTSSAVFPDPMMDDASKMDANDKDRPSETEPGAKRAADEHTHKVHKRSKANEPSTDLADSIPRLYRILDLISEQGSGGLVDKIIIAQDSLKRFLDDVSPGAYQSLTKIDFKALDNLSVKPIGVYGSKTEIVKLLTTSKVVDGKMARLLLDAKDDSNGPRLRSGLYFVRMSLPSTAEEQLFVVYWPEDTTWNDNAISTVRKNRITFIRFLTKIADQTMCVMSDEHAQHMIWKEAADEESMEMDEEGDRFFTFEVAKTNEQEENVTVRPGIELHSGSLHVSQSSVEANIDPSILMPKLITGETVQAFLTARYVAQEKRTTPFRRKEYYRTNVESYFRKGMAIHLDEGLNDSAIQCLIKCGMNQAFGDACKTYERSIRDAAIEAESEKKRKSALVKENVDASKASLEQTMRLALVDHIIGVYPMFKDRFVLFSDKDTDSCDGFNHGKTTADESGDSADMAEDKQGADSTAGNEDAGEGDGNTKEGAHETDKRDSQETTAAQEDALDSIPSFEDLSQMYPDMRREFDNRMNKDNIWKISTHGALRTFKDRLTLARIVMEDENYTELSDEQRRGLMNLIITEGDLRSGLYSNAAKSKKSGFFTVMKELFAGREASVEQEILSRTSKAINVVSDTDFLASLDDVFAREPLLEDLVTRALETAYQHLDTILQKSLRHLTQMMQSIQEKSLLEQISREASIGKDSRCKGYRKDLIREVNSAARPEATEILYVEDISSYTPYWTHNTSYMVDGRVQCRLDPAIQYTVHPLALSTEDQQALQLDHTHIPALREQPRFSYSFKLPLKHRIRLMQLLAHDRCLLIVDDGGDKFHIYLGELRALGGATGNRRPMKVLDRAKLGADSIFSFDETTRLLSLCARQRLLLHIYAFDETFASIRSAHVVELKPWYNGETSIHQTCLVSGSEEVLLIDVSGQARIFSLVTQQFRPASLALERLPINALSSPDGSCLMLVFKETDSSPLVTRAYHWITFGSTEGITLDLPLANETAVLTSIVRRNIVHLAWMDDSQNAIRSYALDITKKVTEFSFQEKGVKSSSQASAHTMHNSLIECHADVWTRFPVIPAIARQTVVTDVNRQRKSLVFVAKHDRDQFAAHFADMIQSFEQRTRKPTGKVLRDIAVEAVTFDDIKGGIMPGVEWDSDISRFHLGEWLVDVFCLIPIHIAITRDNRFVPLKDGVHSADLEKSLLGADVGQIVDALSVGWYESIFQSYQSTKPVKVVSSMGEQSVGKSFALNHLADTSFAGSAMRTTEGVWMAVTPTDTCLVVALDFEGVHSIERSAQEDMLLVLFNAAISNLVLFRNNFALSRDITGLFQSFQSSSTVLDPAVNPTLFKSTLVIIIKDVVDSDKNEIKKEFSLKFQQIVQQEQDANFISKLHAGKLSIIPWPVIESKQFYSYFPTLKSALDRQELTHPSGGEFLQTLKTLMAKLKSNDWGSIDQTLAAHRASRLLELLPVALARGFSDPIDDEPLKNIDTDELIDMLDTVAVFHISTLAGEAVDADSALAALRISWSGYRNRANSTESDWVASLSSYLEEIVNLRVAHVHAWLDANLQRFTAEHANIDNLRRTFASIGAQMKADVELCKVKCSRCDLICLRSRRHSSSESHDCQTNHKCTLPCDFDDDHMDNEEDCGYPAGHSGKHICLVERHLCGEPCALSDKNGCLGDCIKTSGHADDEHICAAQIHACGMPCDLAAVLLPDGSSYSCIGTCRVPSDEQHDEHVCDVRMCPLECELCQRLCSDSNHLHALDRGAHHLCGQSHSCSRNCEAAGFCEIDTAPLSVEATFTGRHEAFQYTKYTQVAKKLRCAKTIPADRTTHDGPHAHNIAPNAFHHCEARCDNCGYYCVLPLGHPQQEHDTSHGSMSKTRWALDDEDGTIELNGHKFGADDDGAPMLCNLVCKEMGRHVHVDYCRAQADVSCQGEGVLHINDRMRPDPDKPKDWISHNLFWKRTGFRDPYSREDQTNFAKCDAMCSGPEHAATGTTPAQPSYCTLPVFHPPQTTPGQGLGYTSSDGHHFSCKNPAVLQQAFHVIFVIDRSGSMDAGDRRPLNNAPSANLIARYSNNRLGAVYSALHSFWMARQAAVNASGSQAARRDAYSVILFDHVVATCIANDFTRTADQLLDAIVTHTARGGTDYTAALQATEALMRQHWSTERTPVVVFLSDGESSVSDHTMQSLGQAAVQLGKHLSFHAVSFGPRNEVLRRMAQIARDVQNRAPRDPALPATAYVESSYAEALDSVRLAETFLGLADSLRKPRGALLR